MKREYDFSQGERGKFYFPDAELDFPIYLDAEVSARVRLLAASRGVGVSELVNELLKQTLPQERRLDLSSSV